MTTAANTLTVTRAKFDRLRAMNYAGRVADLDPSETRRWLSERAEHWILTNDRGAAALMPVTIWDDMAAADRQRAAAATAATLPTTTAELLAATAGDRVVVAGRPWATGELCRELVRVGAVDVQDGVHHLTGFGAAIREQLQHAPMATAKHENGEVARLLAKHLELRQARGVACDADDLTLADTLWDAMAENAIELADLLSD